MTRDQGARRLPEPTFEPPPLPPGFPRWKRFAWDGWDLTIPVDWDLGAIEFGPKGGFLRLDDEFEPRLMLKWQPIQHGFDPAKAIEKYLGKRLKGGDAKPRLGAAIPGIREALKGMEHETYTLVTSSQPTYKAWGLSAYCPRCRRAFVVEMSTDSRVDDSERQVARVLGSLREHTDERLTRW
ncbi:MAG TPA: hypothetical protein PK280_07025, partial [Planctomycetota bacterium]|nr:hypothetical protein [Planctomycetota bacterium]